MKRIVHVILLIACALAIANCGTKTIPVQDYNTKYRVDFVEDIQTSITTFPKYGDSLMASVDKANARLESRLKPLNLLKTNQVVSGGLCQELA